MKTVIVTDGKYRSAIAAVRALGRAGWQVAVTQTADDAHGAPPVFASCYAWETRWIPGRCTDREYPARLLSLCREYDRPVLLCIGAATQKAVALHREAFAEAADFLIAEPEILERLNDKETVHLRAEKLGIPTPKEYSGLPDHFPVVVKPHCGEKFGLKAKDRYKIAKNEEEFQAALDALAPYDPQPIVQKQVFGPGSGVSLLLDRDSRLVCALCHKRVREYPIAGGPSSCCVSEYNEAQVKRAYELLRSFGFVGAAMVEFKGPYLLEVNPRIWGSFPLTEKAGSPFAALYVRAAQGERLPYTACNYAADVKMRFMLNDTLAMLSLLKQGQFRKSWEAFQDIFRAKEALRAKDDPGPFHRYLRETLLGRRR